MTKHPPRYDVAIVGAGPAGLSSAILLGRCRRKTIVFDNGKPRNAAADAIHGYLGFTSIAPLELRDRGREQAATYGVVFCDSKVEHITRSDDCHEGLTEFVVIPASGSPVRARKILLATGMRDELPEIANLRDFYGRSVHHCPYCDGWEHRDQRLVAFGSGHAAVGLAKSLKSWSAEVTACTHGGEISAEGRAELAELAIQLREELVLRLEGHAGVLHRIRLAEGPALECDALFFNSPQVEQSSLASEMGCPLHKPHVSATTPRQGTGVPGVFLAGDADGDVQFAVVAAAEGATAAVAINHQLQEEDWRLAVTTERSSFLPM